MNLGTRLRIEKTIDYHQSVADHHQAKHDDWVKHHPRTAEKAAVEEKKSEIEEKGDKVPKTIEVSKDDYRSPHTEMVELHTEVVRQLREVLDAEPQRPAILDLRESQPMRDPRLPRHPVSRMMLRQ